MCRLSPVNGNPHTQMMTPTLTAVTLHTHTPHTSISDDGGTHHHHPHVTIVGTRPHDLPVLQNRVNQKSQVQSARGRSQIPS